MSQRIQISESYFVKTSIDDTQPDVLEAEISGTTDNIIVTTENIGGDKYLKFDIGSNVFNKSVDTTDDISGGTVNFFVTSDQNDALDNSDSPNAGNPFLTQSAGDVLYLGTGTTFPIAFTVTGSRDSSGSLDRDMEIDGTLTNISPFVMPYIDGILKFISVSSNNIATWQAEVLQDNISIAVLSIVGQEVFSSSLLNVPIVNNQGIRIRQINSVGVVDNPRITLFIQELY